MLTPKLVEAFQDFKISNTRQVNDLYRKSNVLCYSVPVHVLGPLCLCNQNTWCNLINLIGVFPPPLIVCHDTTRTKIIPHCLW